MNIERRRLIRFRRLVWGFYQKHGRHDMPWRHTKDPYKILVSEIMLQQTQVARVEKFYPKFLKAFPNFHVLARAPLRKALRVWQGMGYNRRAVALKRLAQEVVEKHGGRLPNNLEALVTLPGIGKATAGAIMAYAFNEPVPFIETNVRRVFIHFFFTRRHPRLDRGPRKKKQTKKQYDFYRNLLDSRRSLPRSGIRGGNDKLVSDAEILKLVEATLDRKNPRGWYWALMDYGTHLAAQQENPNRRSARYRKQSKFEGSKRQVRGAVIRLLLKRPSLPFQQVVDEVGMDAGVVRECLQELEQESFLRKEDSRYSLSS